MYRFPLTDLPLTGLTELRIGFDLMGEGEVWIDEVQLFDLWFEENERDELLKGIATADVQVSAGQLTDGQRFLDSYSAGSCRGTSSRPISGRPHREPRPPATPPPRLARLLPSPLPASPLPSGPRPRPSRPRPGNGSRAGSGVSHWLAGSNLPQRSPGGSPILSGSFPLPGDCPHAASTGSAPVFHQVAAGSSLVFAEAHSGYRCRAATRRRPRLHSPRAESAIARTAPASPATTRAFLFSPSPRLARRGFEIDDPRWPPNFKFIADFLGRNRANYLAGQGPGRSGRYGRLRPLTLELGGWNARRDDRRGDGVPAGHYHQDLDLLAGQLEPPAHRSQPLHHDLRRLLRALDTFGPPEPQDESPCAREAAREWLRSTPASKHGRLGPFKLHAAKNGRRQREPRSRRPPRNCWPPKRQDGGFAQLDSGDAPDIDPTPTPPARRWSPCIRPAASTPTNRAYQRGLAYLLKTQQATAPGTSPRSKPFQAYFETGFPHGNDQFISSAASAWATTALALACDSPSP